MRDRCYLLQVMSINDGSWFRYRFFEKSHVGVFGDRGSNARAPVFGAVWLDICPAATKRNARGGSRSNRDHVYPNVIYRWIVVINYCLLSSSKNNPLKTMRLARSKLGDGNNKSPLESNT